MCEKSAIALTSAGEALEKAAEFLEAVYEGRIEIADREAIRDACTSTGDAMHLAYVAARAARADCRERRAAERKTNAAQP